MIDITTHQEFDVNGFGPFERINPTPEIVEWAKAALPTARKEADAARSMADSAFLYGGTGANTLERNANAAKWHLQDLEALSRGYDAGLDRDGFEKLAAFVASLTKVEGADNGRK